MDVDVASTFGKNQNASDYDLYIFTCKLFFKINVIQANKNISLWLKKPSHYSDILCSKHNLAKDKNVTYGLMGDQKWSLLS